MVHICITLKLSNRLHALNEKYWKTACFPLKGNASGCVFWDTSASR
jgi:hypothetical protein